MKQIVILPHDNEASWTYPLIGQTLLWNGIDMVSSNGSQWPRIYIKDLTKEQFVLLREKDKQMTKIPDLLWFPAAFEILADLDDLVKDLTKELNKREAKGGFTFA